VERIHARLQSLDRMVRAFFQSFPKVSASLAKTFNTATVQFAINGKFEPAPLSSRDLETFLAAGFKMPLVDVPAPLLPFADHWSKLMEEELTPLVGKSIDPRFIETVIVKL
jgi:hypothetical protein